MHASCDRSTKLPNLDDSPNLEKSWKCNGGIVGLTILDGSKLSSPAMTNSSTFMTKSDLSIFKAPGFS